MSAAGLLTEARTRGQLTQTQLAQRAGTSQAAISDLERGAIEPTHARLAELVMLCGFRLGVGLQERTPLVDRGLLADDLQLFAEQRIGQAARLSQRAFAMRQAGLRADLADLDDL